MRGVMGLGPLVGDDGVADLQHVRFSRSMKRAVNNLGPPRERGFIDDSADKADSGTLCYSPLTAELLVLLVIDTRIFLSKRYLTK